MSIFISGNQYTSANSESQMLIELRVLSNLIQEQMGSQLGEDLKQRRNDQAFELGWVPPTVPGQ